MCIRDRITTYEAIELYTKNAAISTFEEDEKGTIKEGKLADLDVYKRQEIKNARVINDA